jgi:periplasmic protein TonB
MKQLFLFAAFLLALGLRAQTDTTVYHGSKTPPPPPGVAKDTSAAPDPYEYDQAPEFPGGTNEMYRFISVNVRYPQLEKEKGVQGKVFVKFVVEADGSITNVSILKEVPNGPGLSKESMRVVSMMPKWKPGMKNGKAVRTEMVVPINYKLQ